MMNLPLFARRTMAISPLALMITLLGLQKAVAEEELAPVTVTANKIEQDAQNIPQSISAISEEEIEKQRIENVTDIIRKIPNLSISSPFTNRINIRGINSSIFSNINPVVIYIDGIPNSSIWGYDVALQNIERIEVLRGPQGALYGKESIGGVINIITKSPKNKTEGKINIEYGNHQLLKTAFQASAPLINDQLFISASGALTKNEGWIKNTYPGKSENANQKQKNDAALLLTYYPTERITTRLSLRKNSDKKYGIDGFAASAKSNVNDFSFKDFKHVSYEKDTFTLNRSEAASLHFSYEGDHTVFSSVTTYKNMDNDSSYDLDLKSKPQLFNLTQFDVSHEKYYAQEFRLHNTASEGIRWIAGLYFEDGKNDKDRYGVEYPGSAFKLPFDVELNAVSHNTGKTAAVFGQLIWPLNTKNELTLGGRYQTIQKSIDLNFYRLPIGTTGPAHFSMNQKNRWNSFLPKISVMHHHNSQLHSYATISKGYLAGGYGYYASGGQPDNHRFEPQTSINYEIGTKLNHGQWQLNANLFYMDIKDIHTYRYDPTTGIAITSNAGKAHSKGLELEANYQLSSNWKMSAALGLIDAEYQQHQQKYQGNKIEQTPSYTASASIHYQNPHGFYGLVDIHGEGVKFHDAANTIKTRPYWLANAKIGYKTGALDLYAFVNNASNTLYLSAHTPSVEQGHSLLFFNTPRFYGIGMSYYF